MRCAASQSQTSSRSAGAAPRVADTGRSTPRLPGCGVIFIAPFRRKCFQPAVSRDDHASPNRRFNRFKRITASSLESSAEPRQCGRARIDGNPAEFKGDAPTTAKWRKWRRSRTITNGRIQTKTLARTKRSPISHAFAGLNLVSDHHIAGPYLNAHAREMAWREVYRRVSNGEQYLAAAALAHPISRQWKGY